MLQQISSRLAVFRSHTLFSVSPLSLVLFLLWMLPLQAQPAPSLSVSPQTASDLSEALRGHWTGVLEYRDYSEPATSTKRVQLPTWLSIAEASGELMLDYTYDDGPTKVVTSHNTLHVDIAKATYTLVDSSSKPEVYSIIGLQSLQAGRGILQLSGPGTDSGKPAEIHTTLTIRRNLLSWLEEVRPAGSAEPFVFRHRYTFTRAELPVSTTQK